MTGKVDSGVAILSVSAPWCGNDSCLRSWKHANSSRRTCLLFGVHLSYPLFGKPVGNGDQCIAFTFLIWEKWGCLSHGCLPLPFCGGWGCQRWLIDLLASWASSTISRSSSASQDCHTVMRARHQNRKSTVCKQSPPTCAFENLPPPPAPTFCINTNQISPINLLHLISLSTSHPQLKLPYWQMHTHTNNFFFPLSILHCSNPTNDESSGGAVSVLFALKVVNGSKWEDGALLLPRFHVALLCERQPVVSNLGARVPISSFPAKPWHVSAQLHSSSWMFYPWLALMLSSSYCFKAASCNIKAAAQTKHIQAGSWGGKRDNLQQSDHAGFFFFCFNGSEGHAGDLLVQEIL